MQKISVLVLLLFFVSCRNADDSLDGKTFVGIERSNGCGDLILAQNTFRFFGDSVLLKRKYIKHFSKVKMKESYQYKGWVATNHSEIEIHVVAYKCPDCNVWNHVNAKTGALEKWSDQKTFKGFYKDGKLTLNHFVYKK